MINYKEGLKWWGDSDHFFQPNTLVSIYQTSLQDLLNFNDLLRWYQLTLIFQSYIFAVFLIKNWDSTGEGV